VINYLTVSAHYLNKAVPTRLKTFWEIRHHAFNFITLFFSDRF